MGSHALDAKLATVEPAGVGLGYALRGRGFPKSGSARLGSQKDGLPSRSRALMKYRVQGCRRAHREGQPGRCPFKLGLWENAKTTQVLVARLKMKNPGRLR